MGRYGLAYSRPWYRSYMDDLETGQGHIERRQDPEKAKEPEDNRDGDEDVEDREYPFVHVGRDEDVD